MRKGQSLTDEQKMKLRVLALGRKLPPFSNEHCEKISTGLKRYNSELTTDEKAVRYFSNTLIRHTDESIQVLSKSMTDFYANGGKPSSWIADREEASRRRSFRALCKGLIRRCTKYGFQLVEVTEIGYSPQDLKQHIENQFAEGMSWENYGRWHIDHIRPISSFPTETSVAEVNALKNLRPLWADENLRRPRKVRPEEIHS